jgi:hypothetical protein
MPAGVREIPRPQREKTGSTRLGQLRQRPADDSTEEDWSRAMKTKLLQRLSRQKQTAPTRPAEAQDKSDERHDHDRPMRDRRPFPTMGSEAKDRGYALQMPAQGKGTL